MELKDMFSASWSVSRAESTVEATIRFLGLDVSVALYGTVRDWVFPFMFLPTLKGVFAQSLFLAVFIGRIPEGMRK